MLQPKTIAPRTTDSAHGQRCVPNLLFHQARPTQTNWVWVSDSTYLPLASGAWAYLCAFRDVFTKHVMGWQMRADMPKVLVTSTLQRALLAHRPAPWFRYPLRPGSYLVGWAIRGQRLQGPVARRQSPALAEPPWSYPVGRMLRQRPTGYNSSQKLLVAP